MSQQALVSSNAREHLRILKMTTISLSRIAIFLEKRRKSPTANKITAITQIRVITSTEIELLKKNRVVDRRIAVFALQIDVGVNLRFYRHFSKIF